MLCSSPDKRIGLFALSLLLLSCAGPEIDRHPIQFEKSVEGQGAFKPLWSRELPGEITDLDTSQAGNRVLVSAIPDIEKDDGIKRPHILLYNEKGELLWKKMLEARVKSQVLAPDGSVVFVSTFDQELKAIGHLGKVLWTYNGSCEPHLLPKKKHIVCYQSEDNSDRSQFYVLDWNGKKVQYYRTRGDGLGVSVSKDEKWLALSLTGGWIHYISTSNYRRRWRQRVRGEIVDIKISSEPKAALAVLYLQTTRGVRGGQRLAIFSASAKKIFDQKLAVHADELRFADQGGKLILYGNSPQGQYLSFFERGKTNFEQKWKYLEEHFADYSSSVLMGSEVVVVGFEDILSKSSGTRHNHVFGFDHGGKVKYDLPLKSEEGAYLYSLPSRAPKKTLYLATDQSKLSAYEMRLSPQKSND